MNSLRLLTGACLLASAALAADPAASSLKFDLGSGALAPGYTQVLPDMVYSKDRGFGFEPGATLTAVTRSSGDPLRGDFVTSDKPFHFTARVPAEGNYRVTVTLGDADGESDTTIKAELRRLMVEKVHTAKGRFERVSFIVNTRTPQITPVGDMKPGEVRLKAPRESVQEAWAWDDAITLEFNNAHPAVCAIEIEPVKVPTIFLIGDSTVCDQVKEPYNSWGQMFTRWFVPEVAISNHGESGESYRDSIGRRRLDKIVSMMQPGDFLLMQFGHNDQKQIAAKTGNPTTYKEEMKKHVDAARARGGIPIIISPMERRAFDDHGKIKPSLTDYAAASREAARDLGVAFIDLNAMSIPFYEALGPERSALAFARSGSGQVDNTHHNNFGSYELSQAIVQSIRDQKLPLAKFISPDFKGFNPAHPDSPESFTVPASGDFTNQRPLGD